MKKDILISESDFKELERKANLWEGYKYNHQHTLDLTFTDQHSHFFNFIYFNKSYNIPQDLKECVDKIQEEMFRKMTDIREKNILQKEIEELQHELNKTPKWIRKLYGGRR